jgi:hypothetical protein
LRRLGEPPRELQRGLLDLTHGDAGKVLIERHLFATRGELAVHARLGAIELPGRGVVHGDRHLADCLMVLGF